ncbi:MAG TPA: hypothetical protein VGE52_15620, partial [Pirellulales bacterium]
MRAVRRVFMGSVALCAALTVSLARADWPPADGANAEAVIAGLLSEVHRIALQDPDAGRRAWAWRALARFDDERVNDIAAYAPLDPSPGVRRQHMTALCNLVNSRDPRTAHAATDAAVAGLHDLDVGVRSAAAESLCYADRAIRESLWMEFAAGLCDESEAVRLNCLDSLSSEDAASALLSAVVVGSPDVQRWALLELWQPAVAPIAEYRRVLPAASRAALSSPSPDVAFFAAYISLVGDVTVQQLLDSPNPLVRISVFHCPWWPNVSDDQHAQIVLQYADDPNPLVAAAALHRGTANPAGSHPDRDTLLEWLAASDEARVDFASAVLFDLDRRERSPQALFELAAQRLAEFRAAAIGSPARRAATLWLAEFVRRSYEQVQTPHQLDWPEPPDETNRFCTWRAEPAFVISGDVVEALIAALDDPDPRVRRAACTSLGAAANTADAFGGRRSERGDDLWQRVFARIGDDDLAVRRAVAGQFEPRLGSPADLTPLIPSSPSPLRTAYAAAMQAVRDSDPQIQRLAARRCRGCFWTPAAASILASEIERGADDSVELLATLLDHAPDSIPLDTAARQVAHLPLERDHAWMSSDGDWPAMRALLQADALDRWLRIVEATSDDRADEDFREVMGELGYKEELREKLDARDFAAVIDFAERIDSTRCDLLANVAEEVFYCCSDGEDRVLAWANETAGRPGLRYAAVEYVLRDAPANACDWLGSDDAVVSLMALASFVDRAAGADPAIDPPGLNARQKILLTEARRVAAWH